MMKKLLALLLLLMLAFPALAEGCDYFLEGYVWTRENGLHGLQRCEIHNTHTDCQNIPYHQAEQNAQLFQRPFGNNLKQ